jgi:hypothetical protein
MEFNSIAAPPDWTADKDIAAFVSRYGESDSYVGDQTRRLSYSWARLERTIDRALTYFGIGVAHPIDGFEGEIDERLFILRAHVLDNARSQHYKKVLVEAIWYCERSLSEYERILSEHHDRRENNWLWNLIELEDRMASAAQMLEDAMCREHSDFEDRTDLPEKL